MKKTHKHTIRIIGGEYRSRLLTVIDHEGLRPTGNRMRETLFNWLQPLLINRQCLDLFAGSGALGMEALSRGAKSVTFVEKDRAVYNVLHINVTSICKDHVRYQLLKSDALQVLAQNEKEYQLIFLDPPFGQLALLQTALEVIDQLPIYQSLKYLVVECPIKARIVVPDGFQLHREMTTQESRLALFVRD